MSGDPETLAHYEASVPYYVSAFDRSHSRHLDAFLDGLATGAHILELGCGTGRDAARMIARGFTVDPTDGTRAMVERANGQRGVGARVMRFDELDAQEEYDAVWAHACLFHVPRAQLPLVLAAIHRALRSGGQHYASFKLGDDEFRDDRGRLNSRVSDDEMAGRYRETGFAVRSIIPWQGEGADGVLREWIAVTAHKD